MFDTNNTNAQDKKKILFAEKIAKQNWSHKIIKDEGYSYALACLSSEYTDVEVFLKDHFWFLSNFDHIRNISGEDSVEIVNTYEEVRFKETFFEIFKLAIEESERFLYPHDINGIKRIIDFNSGYNLEKLINYIFVSMPNQGLLQGYSHGENSLVDDSDYDTFF